MNGVLGLEYIQSPDSGLVAYYKFDKFEDLAIDQDGQDDVRDASSHQNHGDTRGNPTLITSGAFSLEGIEPIETSNDDFILYQNQPNPFKGMTSIRFSIPTSAYVKLSVLNFLGKEVAVIANRTHTKGSYIYTWETAGIPEGMYFLRMEADSFVNARKMVIRD